MERAKVEAAPAALGLQYIANSGKGTGMNNRRPDDTITIPKANGHETIRTALKTSLNGSESRLFHFTYFVTRRMT